MDTKETVLVVDDDREIVGAIALALEKEGYRVLRAYDGMEALDHALDPELRLILMDVMMPVMDGLTAAREIHATNRVDAAEIPIFAMTANAFYDDVRQSKEAGMVEHLSKPIQEQELLDAIRRHVKR